MSAVLSGQSRARGFALIIVLWFLVLIGAIGITLILNARSETEIAHNTRAAADAEALADAGIARAAFNQLDPVQVNQWPLDGSVHHVALSAGDVAIRITDETQKINPNLASAELLTGLFEASGVELNRARHLGAATADWVSPDGPPSDMGAKRDQYREAGKSYEPPNAPLETLDDLNLVLGMTPEILARVRPYLTIYTQSAEPSGKGAPLIVQQALALAAQLSGDSPDDNDTNTDAGTGAGPISPSPANAPPNGPATPAAASANPADKGDERLIAVEATGRSRDGGVYVRRAVLRLGGDNPQGYDILDWERGSLPAETAKLSG